MWRSALLLAGLVSSALSTLTFVDDIKELGSARVHNTSNTTIDLRILISKELTSGNEKRYLVIKAQSPFSFDIKVGPKEKLKTVCSSYTNTVCILDLATYKDLATGPAGFYLKMLISCKDKCFGSVSVTVDTKVSLEAND